MDIYREEILEHWQNPMNFGEIDNADLIIEQINPLCGDEVTFFFKFDGKGKKRIKQVKFIGEGCAISIASASILSEKIRGKSIEAISKITGEDVFEMLGGSVTPARLKCAFLPLEAIKKVVGAK